MDHRLSTLETSPPGAAPSHIRRKVLTVLIVGTLLRFGVLAISSPEINLPFWQSYGWPADHANYVQWARQATDPDKGFLTVYSMPPEQEIKVRLSYGEKFVHHGAGEIANYPPLGMFLVYVQGLIHRQLDPEFMANTAGARAVFAIFSLIGDLLLALGVLRLARMMFGHRAGLVALSLIYLTPPMWLDSVWWGQTDSWELAPAIWIVYFLTQRRWWGAGILWGIALAIKPQAVLLSPVWLFVWVATFTREWRGRFGACVKHDWAKMIGAGVLALVVLNITALPFWLSTGDAWLQESYLRNLTDEQPHTTLKAFNIWYVDLLLTYNTDVTQTIAGVTKDAWGKILGMLAMAGSAWIAWRSRLDVHQRAVLFCGLWLLSVVMFPTRVHERYILLCLPFLIVCVAGMRRLWPGVIALIVIACVQLTVYHWLQLGADSWSRKYLDDTVAFHRNAVEATPPELRDKLPTLEKAIDMRFVNFRKEHAPYRPYEWGFTLLGLFAAGATYVGAVNGRKKQQHDQEFEDASD